MLTGNVYEGSPNNTPMQFVNAVTTGNTTANVLAASLMPGTIGIYQASLQLNTGLTTDPETQLTIAQNLFVSNIVTFPLVSAPTLTAAGCSVTSLNSSGTATCGVSLATAAPSGGVTVAISSNDTLLTVPATVVVPGGATSANFTITSGSIPSTQTAVITVTLNTSSETVDITLNP